jgi:N-acetyl-gamma-glutamyl-phosphate reductase
VTRVFIDGAQGTTGLEIRDRLAGRADLEMIEIDEGRRKDMKSRREALNDADIVILCLPDAAARDAVSMIGNPRTRVIDASTAHRTAPGWTYGFPEIGFDIAAATRVSNPGCYPTGFLALVVPLVRAGLLAPDWPVTVNAVSGYSGGGKAMIEEFESGRAMTAWRSYALTLAHKHVAEMQIHASLTHRPLFSPSVADTYRGMIVEVPLVLEAMPDRPNVQEISDCIGAAFEGSTLLGLVDAPDLESLALEHAANTDRVDLFVLKSESGDQVRLVAALDNLGKGAAGAAVQSLNILSGVSETTGLRI